MNLKLHTINIAYFESIPKLQTLLQSQSNKMLGKVLFWQNKRKISKQASNSNKVLEIADVLHNKDLIPMSNSGDNLIFKPEQHLKVDNKRKTYKYNEE